LALDWDHQQVHLVSARTGKAGVRIERALAWREERSPNPAEAEALGELLRDRLKAENIAPAPLLVCVGRDRVIVKEVRYPVVPPAEEPAVVRFQAIKELTEPPEEVVIDYVPVDDGADSGQRRGLVLVLRRELLTTYKTMCRTAGLKLQGITPRPFGILACLQHVMSRNAATPAPDPPEAAVAVLTMSEGWAEFDVIRRGNLVFARSLTTGAALAGELRRNLALYAGQSHQHPVRALYVAGGSDRERLQETLAIPVHAFDPLLGLSQPDLPEQARGGFAGATGLLVCQGSATGLPINFAQPKQPRQETTPNQKRLMIAAIAGAVLLLLAVVACAIHLEIRSSQEDDLREELASLDESKRMVSEDEKRYKAVDDWTRSEVVWLDELYDITAAFPDPTGIRLKIFTGTPQERLKSHIAQISMTGVTSNDERLLDEFMLDLRKELHYTVHPREPSRNTEDFRFFPRQFKLKVEVKKRQPADYRRELRVAAPVAERGRREP
jgi:Tfp pilus assembly PilM family ATPase